MSVPLLSLGSSTVRSNPLQSTSYHCKINRSSWPKKTQISEKKYEAISNHAYKRSKKTQITFMDKKIDLIINSKFIRSQQTHGKKSCKARIVLVPSRITRWVFYHIAWIYPSTSCHLAYGVTLFLPNTLDACWIVVDEWSNSSRCRIVSIYLSRTWCLYTWSCLDIS